MHSDNASCKRMMLVVVMIAVVLIISLSQTSCTPQNVSALQPFEINLYFDPTIVWVDQETRDKLIAEIIAGLRDKEMITKVKVVEVGKTKKASEVFSADFDFGPPVNCPVKIPRELTGNAEAERQAREESKQRCAPEFERRRKHVEGQLKRLTDFLNRPSKGLTNCTSFTDFITRLRRDDPTVGLVVTDGRANCQEEIQTYAPTHASRIIVIQCPSPDGKTDERTKLLKQMLPTAKVLMMHQAAEAMKLLTENNTGATIASDK